MAAVTTEKWKRLREMPAGEVAYRLREKLHSGADRLAFYLGTNGYSERNFERAMHSGGVAAPAAVFSFKDYLRDFPFRRFYAPSDSSREAQAAWVAAHFSDWVDAAVADADRLCRHRLPLLGYGEVDLGAEIDWHRDPLTGQVWPRRFWADYDLAGDSAAGDPKTIHELNRHQHLPRLAKAYFLTGEERYAREAVAQMESWIEQNPRGLGINWQSSLELALRSVSWIWTLFFLRESRALDEKAARRIAKSLSAQLGHIYRFPSVFTSPNTHLIGEATALFIAGTLFAELRHAAAWRRFGHSVLLREMHGQVGADGVHGELATYYHCYTLDFYLQAMTLARRAGIHFPQPAWQKLERMVEFTLNLSRSDGSLPLIGDDDGGRALALRQVNYRRASDLLASAAVLFRRGDFKRQSGAFAEEAFWLHGEEGWNTYASLAPETPHLSADAFASAGYWVQRSGWEPSDSRLIFQCGGESGGLGLFRGAHRHADALSVTLAVAGEEILTDPGTFLYNNSPHWRDFFRSTHAHNTVVVDDRSQWTPGGTFHWARRAPSSVGKQFALPEMEYVEGGHEAYNNGPGSPGIAHRRRVIWLRPDYWVVLDDFHGAGRHCYDFYWHFSPRTSLSVWRGTGQSADIEATARAGDAALQMRLCASDACVAEVLGGSDQPLQGWVADLYGQKQPAPVLRARMHSGTPPHALWVLAPSLAPAGEISASRVTTAAGEAIAVRLDRGATADLLVWPLTGGEVEIGELRLRGDFFCAREENGVLTQLLAVNATRLQHAGRVFFTSRAPVSHIVARFSEDAITVEPAVVKDTLYVRNLWNR